MREFDCGDELRRSTEMKQSEDDEQHQREHLRYRERVAQVRSAPYPEVVGSDGNSNQERDYGNPQSALDSWMPNAAEILNEQVRAACSPSDGCQYPEPTDL